MLRWLELQAETFPRPAVRARCKALRARLAIRSSWEQKAYESAVRGQGFRTLPPADSDYRWCQSGLNWGRGGYSCAPWVLFHTTLANVPKGNAAFALQAIALWVNDFFGCDECARHFIQYYEEHEGEQVNNNQIETVLWLWNAHNAVTARLKASEEADSAFEDGVSTRLSRYPTETSCEPCYNASKGEAFHEPHSVFEYLQEVYCFESDTFVCSAFDDPSKGTEGREKAKDEV